MSLVNKMLRDLDARRAGDGNRAALPAAVTPLAARREPGGISWLWLGTVLAAAGLAAAAWYGTQQGDSAAPAPVRLTVAPVAAGPAAVAPAIAAPTIAAPAAPTAAEPKEPVGAGTPVPVTSVALPSLRMADALFAAPAVTTDSPPKAMEAPPKASERSTAASIPLRPPVKTLSAPAEASIDKQVRLPSPAERAETEYRRGILAQRQGNAEDAAGSYRAALEDYPEHAAARQTLAALLIEAKRFDEAEELLRKGAELAPVRLASTLAWARLKVERNQATAALELLQKNAASGERSAEYQAFTGALLNRAGRAQEAVERYQAATRLAPNEGRWWAGLGIALDAAGKSLEAREVYQKARALPGLPVDLAQHIEQRLR
ncbi:MAG: tetratricopeptide repeat protein [Rhodocyclaceae bacterium]|nr:tetratricopeptide repeat protein [Rhodocyclaceae bacterium]